jgi:hypothetical protein
MDYIYNQSLEVVKKYPEILEGKWDKEIPVYNTNLPILKNSFFYALGGNDSSKLPQVIKSFNIWHPSTKLNEEVAETAKDISLFDSENSILYKPSASYEWGANPLITQRKIWDCSSLAGVVLGLDFRATTADFEYAWRLLMNDELSGEESKKIKDYGQTEAYENLTKLLVPLKEETFLDDLKPMDLIVWRKFDSKKGVATAGHVGFYLGKDGDDDNKIILGDSNRFDDYSFEGTGIRSVEYLKKDESETISWRTFVLRKKD